MIELIQKNILNFVILVFLQVLILNNIQLSGFVNPYLYVLFIILLPFEISGWMLLVTAFIMGITIDIFSNTIGMHTAATVAMAFMRPKVLDLMSPRDGYEINTLPRIRFYGFWWFFKYSAVLIIVHHLFLFYMEVFSFEYFFTTFFRAISNIVITLILVILSQYLTSRK
mgnify:CR=1 FL=1